MGSVGHRHRAGSMNYDGRKLAIRAAEEASAEEERRANEEERRAKEEYSVKVRLRGGRGGKEVEYDGRDPIPRANLESFSQKVADGMNSLEAFYQAHCDERGRKRWKKSTASPERSKWLKRPDVQSRIRYLARLNGHILSQDVSVINLLGRSAEERERACAERKACETKWERKVKDVLGGKHSGTVFSSQSSSSSQSLQSSSQSSPSEFSSDSSSSSDSLGLSSEGAEASGCASGGEEGVPVVEKGAGFAPVFAREAPKPVVPVVRESAKGGDVGEDSAYIPGEITKLQKRMMLDSLLEKTYEKAMSSMSSAKDVTAFLDALARHDLLHGEFVKPELKVVFPQLDAIFGEAAAAAVEKRLGLSGKKLPGDVAGAVDI